MACGTTASFVSKVSMYYVRRYAVRSVCFTRSLEPALSLDVIPGNVQTSSLPTPRLATGNGFLVLVTLFVLPSVQHIM